MKVKSRRLTALFLATLMVLLVSSIQHDTVMANHAIAESRSDLSGLNVAVYFGTGLSAVEASRIALVNMYKWMNASTVEILNDTEIQNGALWDYDILAMPGGNPISYSIRLGTEGSNAIREWVYSGGSYFGVCGGAIFACRVATFDGEDYYYPLKLFNGSCLGPLGTLGGMATININNTCEGPDLANLSATNEILYQGGGYYVPDEGQNMYTIATYDYSPVPAMIAATYGNGTFCLSAPHPEYEENDTRDGTDKWDDDYNDPDSEWDLMLRVSLWQIETSIWVLPTTTSTTTIETTTTTSSTTTSSVVSTTESTTTTEETTTTSESTPAPTSMDLFLPIVAFSGIAIVLVVVVVILKRR